MWTPWKSLPSNEQKSFRFDYVPPLEINEGKIRDTRSVL